MIIFSLLLFYGVSLPFLDLTHSVSASQFQIIITFHRANHCKDRAIDRRELQGTGEREFVVNDELVVDSFRSYGGSLLKMISAEAQLRRSRVISPLLQ